MSAELFHIYPSDLHTEERLFSKNFSNNVNGLHILVTCIGQAEERDEKQEFDHIELLLIVAW